MGNLYETSTEQMHLVNLQDGKILYSSKEELKGTVMEEEMLTASLNNIEEESYNFIWKDEAFAGVNVVDTVEEPYMNLLLIKQIPDAVIYQNLDNLLKFIMFLAIAAGLLLLVTGSVNAYLLRVRYMLWSEPSGPSVKGICTIRRKSPARMNSVNSRNISMR